MLRRQYPVSEVGTSESMSRDVPPPSGYPPPTTATLGGAQIALVPLAEAVADRYFAEFPEDATRYGDAARQWEVHDTLHCLYWAVLDAEGSLSLDDEIAWLASVLRARDFPLEHLARNLELAADVVAQEPAAAGSVVAERLRASAAVARSR
jgi:hypothetical protein